MVDKFRLDDAVFRYIEHELYDYEDNIKNLQEMKEDIAQAGISNLDYSEGGGQTNKKKIKSSKTEMSTSQILQSKTIRRMANNITYIDRALKKLDREEKKRLYVLKYRKNKPWQQVMMDLKVSRSTFFRWRREIVYIVAKEMGLAN